MVDQDRSFRVQVRVKLITQESDDYRRVSLAKPDEINRGQPVFPSFDMAVTKGYSRLSDAKQSGISEEVDDRLKQLGLWDDVLEGVTPEHVEQMPKRGNRAETKYFDVGVVEGNVDEDPDTFDYDLSLDELEHYIHKVKD